MFPQSWLSPFCPVLDRALWKLTFSSGSPGGGERMGEFLTGVGLEKHNYSESLS